MADDDKLLTQGTTLSYTYNGTVIDESDFEKLKYEYKTLDESRWVPVHEEKDLKVYRQQMNKTDDEIYTFKAYMTFANVDQQLVYSLAVDLTLRKLWDPIYITVKEVEKLTNESDVIYTQLKMPYPVKNRDSCLLRVVQRRDKYIMVICKTTEHKDCVCDTKHFIRTFTPMHAYLIEKDEAINGCHLFVLSTHDPKGSIPKFIVRLVLSRSPVQWHSQLKAVIDKIMKSGWNLEITNGTSPDNNLIRNQVSRFLLSKL